MTAPLSARLWLCPKCGRHVPVRVDTCRCGTQRGEAGSTPAASPGLQPASTGSPAEDLVYPNEKALFAISLIISAPFWILLIVGTMGAALIWAVFFFVFYLFVQSALIAYIKGTAVRLSPQQFPSHCQTGEQVPACTAAGKRHVQAHSGRHGRGSGWNGRSLRTVGPGAGQSRATPSSRPTAIMLINKLEPP